jgi:hypothetical protein
VPFVSSPRRSSIPATTRSSCPRWLIRSQSLSLRTCPILSLRPHSWPCTVHSAKSNPSATMKMPSESSSSHTLSRTTSMSRRKKYLSQLHLRSRNRATICEFPRQHVINALYTDSSKDRCSSQIRFLIALTNPTSSARRSLIPRHI